MEDRTRDLLDKAVTDQTADYGVVLPPWEAYPDIERFSIGWRMGGGEWHLMVWWHWWQAIGYDQAQQLEYFRKHLPPTEWLDWAAEAIWPGTSVSDDAAFNHAAVQRLARHGIGSYAAWAAWMAAIASRRQHRCWRGITPRGWSGAYHVLVPWENVAVTLASGDEPAHLRYVGAARRRPETSNAELERED